MKLFKKVLAGVAVAAAMATSAQAGVVASSYINISTLGFAPATSSAAPTFTITGESRTGTAAANYNSVVATGVGSNSITANGNGAVDIGYRCAGDCDAATAALYGGFENSTTKIGTPGQANYALGDMNISGSALGGAVVGLTRSDAVSTGPTNEGGSSATILNGGIIKGTVTFGQDFTGRIVLGGTSWLQTWIDPLNVAPEYATALAGYGWNISLTRLGNTIFTFAPGELNKTAATDNAVDNFNYDFSGFLQSAEFSLLANTSYGFSINQSTNATISDVPEPETLALVGLGLLGLAAARRRKQA